MAFAYRAREQLSDRGGSEGTTGGGRAHAQRMYFWLVCSLGLAAPRYRDRIVTVGDRTRGHCDQAGGSVPRKAGGRIVVAIAVIGEDRVGSQCHVHGAVGQRPIEWRSRGKTN